MTCQSEKKTRWVKSLFSNEDMYNWAGQSLSCVQLVYFWHCGWSLNQDTIVNTCQICFNRRQFWILSKDACHQIVMIPTKDQICALVSIAPFPAFAHISRTFAQNAKEKLRRDSRRANRFALRIHTHSGLISRTFRWRVFFFITERMGSKLCVTCVLWVLWVRLGGSSFFVQVSFLICPLF